MAVGTTINFACPTDFKNLLNAIAVGEQYLFGGTRAAGAAATRTGDATALEAHGSFGEPTGASTAAAATRTGDATALEARGSFGEPTGTATAPAAATARVEVALGAPASLSGSNVSWGGTSAGPSLGDVSSLSPAAVALLRYFRITIAASRFYASLRTVVAVADSPSVSGPDLSDLWEMSDVAVTLRVPGMDDLVLVGPAAADSLSDSTEPYQWLLSTAQNTASWGAGASAWFTDYNALTATQRAGTVLILDDGEAVEDVTRTGDATALVAHGSFGEPTGTRSAAATRTGDADPLEAHGSFGEPTGALVASANRTGSATALEARGSFGEPTGTTVASATRTGSATALEAHGSFGEPTGTRTAATTLLALDDAELPDGHEAEALALLEASGDAILYADTSPARAPTPR